VSGLDWTGMEKKKKRKKKNREQRGKGMDETRVVLSKGQEGVSGQWTESRWRFREGRDKSGGLDKGFSPPADTRSSHQHIQCVGGRRV
jgi:hypothetical protein